MLLCFWSLDALRGFLWDSFGDASCRIAMSRHERSWLLKQCPLTCHVPPNLSLWAAKNTFFFFYYSYPSHTHAHLSRGHCSTPLFNCIDTWKQYATLGDTVTWLGFQLVWSVLHVCFSTVIKVPVLRAMIFNRRVANCIQHFCVLRSTQNLDL